MFLKIRLGFFQTAVRLRERLKIKDLYFSGSTALKQVALTFDDGPDDLVTPQILDMLKQYGVKATFFLVGEMAEQFPAVVQRIAEEGHVVANHTWSHPRMSGLAATQIQAEVRRTEDLIAKILGFRTTLFRPPYGIITLSMLKELSMLGYKTVIWTVDTQDWAGLADTEIIARVKKNIKPGGIILQHSASHEHLDVSNTVSALPKLLELLRSSGFAFVTVPQLIGEADKKVSYK